MKLKDNHLTVPTITDDEHIYSALARLAFSLGLSMLQFSEALFKMYLIDPHSSKIVAMVEDLDEALRHIPFHYQSSTMEPEKQKALKEKYGRGERVWIESKLIPNWPSLSYCPLCLREDIKEHGIPYFHVTHQVEGVCCPKHGVSLIPYNYKKKGLICPVLTLSDYQEPVFEDSAFAGACALLPEFTGLNREILADAYNYFFIEEKGYIGNNHTVDSKKVYRDIESMYERERLEHLGALPHDVANFNWISRICRKSTKAIIPVIYHLLVWNCYGLNKEKILEYAKKYREKQKEETLRPCLVKSCPGNGRQVAIMSGIRYFKCDVCGTIYNNKFFQEFGEPVREEIRMRKENGQSIPRISREMGIYREHIRDILKGGPGKAAVTGRLKKFREAATQYKTRKELKEKNGTAYLWLRQFDPDYLDSLFPKKVNKPVPRTYSREELDRRDKEMSERLLKDLGLLLNGGQISKTRLLREGYIPQKFNKEKYPKTWEITELIVEDMKEYHERINDGILEEWVETELLINAPEHMKDKEQARQAVNEAMKAYRETVLEHVPEIYDTLFPGMEEEP